MPKYVKKPIVIEAIQLTWENWSIICDFVGVGKLSDGKPEGHQNGEKIGLDIPTNEGIMHANENDYIIKEPFPTNDRLFYPCKSDIFKATYELYRR